MIYEPPGTTPTLPSFEAPLREEGGTHGAREGRGLPRGRQERRDRRGEVGGWDLASVAIFS